MLLTGDSGWRCVGEEPGERPAVDHFLLDEELGEGLKHGALRGQGLTRTAYGIRNSQRTHASFRRVTGCRSACLSAATTSRMN